MEDHAPIPIDAGGQDPYRARLYRIVLGLAALYNIGFGLWAALRPGSFFDLFAMDPPLYPAIWRCLGMVIGLYGLGYGYAALRLDRAWPFVAIGLLGKVLGPIGWVLTVASGEWPPQTFTLIVFNDLVWWLPFSLFLLEGSKMGARIRAITPYACALINAAAAATLLLVLRGGTEAVADMAERAQYIGQHLALWRAGWTIWMAAAVSLVAFYAWWGARLQARNLATMAFLIATAGLACDLLAESLYIGWLPDHLEAIQRGGTLLTGGVANGLYTLAGILLTAGTPWLRGALRLWAWAIWLSGFMLSAFSLVGSVAGIVASSAALMSLFPPWAGVMGWRSR